MAEIREGTAANLDAVLALWRRSGAPPSVTDTLESLSALLDHDPRSLLVAYADGDLVGCLIAAWNGWRGSFFRLAVDPRHRRRGIATALVREGERRLRSRGATRIDAIVVADDVTATAAWRVFRYQPRGDQERFVRDFGTPSG